MEVAEVWEVVIVGDGVMVGVVTEEIAVEEVIEEVVDEVLVRVDEEALGVPIPVEEGLELPYWYMFSRFDPPHNSAPLPVQCILHAVWSVARDPPF